MLQSPPTLPPAVSPVTVTAQRELRAKMQCTVTAEGRLSDCRVISESPPGMGAGAAALRLARLFKMKPHTVDGRPLAGGTVVIPLVFRGGTPAASTDPTAPPPRTVPELEPVQPVQPSQP